MFCGQGQSIIFTFSNAELLVIEAIHNDKQFEHILQGQTSWSEQTKIIICHMDWL